jgi:hypothetical protein
MIPCILDTGINRIELLLIDADLVSSEPFQNPFSHATFLPSCVEQPPLVLLRNSSMKKKPAPEMYELFFVFTPISDDDTTAWNDLESWIEKSRGVPYRSRIPR